MLTTGLAKKATCHTFRPLGPHLGRIYELTGPRSQDMHGVAREFSDALNREVTYSDIPAEDWERELKKLGLPEHLTRHLVTLGELHRAGRYDRLRSEEHTSELQSPCNLVCRLLLEKKKKTRVV